MKVPAIVWALAAAAWAAASWTMLSVGQGVRLAYAPAAGALVLLMFLVPTRRTRLYVPQAARWHLIGIALIVTGMAVGLVRAGVTGRQLLTLAGYAGFAALPLVLLLRMRATPEQLRRLAQWFVVGAALSVLAAPLLGEIASIGRWTGGGGHMNQLAATSVMALPLIRLCLPSHPYRVPVRVALWVLFLIGIQQSGSRSGLIGALIVMALLLLNWVRRGPKRVLAGALLILVAVVVVPSIDVEDFDTQSALGRFASEEGRPTDEGRVQKLDEGLAYLGSDAALFGGATFDRSPHNAYLEVWVTGGLISLVGLAIVFARSALCAVRSAAKRDPLDLTGRLAISVVGFMAVVAFNNALWFPYTWMILALFVTSLSLSRTRRTVPRVRVRWR